MRPSEVLQRGRRCLQRGMSSHEGIRRLSLDAPDHGPYGIARSWHLVSFWSGAYLQPLLATFVTQSR